MFPNARLKSHGMDFVLSDMQGSVFGQLLSDYARKRKQQKTGQSTQEGVKIVARGDKWTMWFLGRELRFEKRMADTWGDEARWRRDFTINSLFYHLQDQTVEDYTHQGLDDVANRLLRTTIPAESSLWYDPVRILRAIRFSRSHQLNFDSELEYAMENHEIQSRFATHVQPARVEAELKKMLIHKNSVWMYKSLARYNLHPVLFKFPASLCANDSDASPARSPPSALSTFSSLPPLAAEISLPVNSWDRLTTTKALSSTAYLRKLLQRPKQKEDLKESMALLLAFVSPSLLANWSGHNPFSVQLARVAVREVKSALALPDVWAKELRELLSATVNLLHIAHEFIPTIHAFHLMEDEDSSEIESGYRTLVHRRKHDLLHWLRHYPDYWRLATLLGHTMLIHGSPRYYFDWELFYSALDSSGVSAAAFSSPVLNGNEIKALLPPELPGKLIGELKDALVSWQWEVDNPTTEGAIQFVRDYIATAAAQTNK